MAGRRARARAAKRKRINLEAFEAQERERNLQIHAKRGLDRYERGFKSSVVAVAEGAGNQGSNGESRGAAFVQAHKQASMAKLDRDVKLLSRTKPLGEVIGRSDYGTGSLKSMPVAARKLVLPAIEFEADMTKVRAERDAKALWQTKPMETRDRRKRRTLTDK